MTDVELLMDDTDGRNETCGAAQLVSVCLAISIVLIGVVLFGAVTLPYAWCFFGIGESPTIFEGTRCSFADGCGVAIECGFAYEAFLATFVCVNVIAVWCIVRVYSKCVWIDRSILSRENIPKPVRDNHRIYLVTEGSIMCIGMMWATKDIPVHYLVRNIVLLVITFPLTVVFDFVTLVVRKIKDK